MFSRGMFLGVLATACFMGYALLGAVGPVMEQFGPGSTGLPPDILFHSKTVLRLAGTGLLLACIVMAVPAFVAGKAGLLGQAAATLVGIAAAMSLVRLADVPLPLPFPVSSMALLLIGAALLLFALEKLADNRGGVFNTQTMNTRPAAIILAVAGGLMLLTSFAPIGEGGGSSGPRTFRTRFGGIRTSSGRAIEIPPAISAPLFALAICGLLLNCAFVLRSFRQAADTANLATTANTPENVPDIDTRPWNSQKATDARPDHLRRGDDSPVAS